MELQILGVRIDNITLDEVTDKIRHFLQQDSQHQIVTVNPEFIMAAQNDEEFMNILNSADLSIADGVGLKYAARKYNHKLVQRITGVDLMMQILAIAAEEGKSIYLLGAKRGIAEQAAFKILEKFPNIKVVGAESGYRHWHRRIKDAKLVEKINRKQPDILFVAFGQVKQDKWIAHHLSKITSVKVAMGVGGSFDYISGKVSRAPSIVRRMGLEWLFRLFRQPWRLPRIITAVIRFSWAVLRQKNN